MGSGSVLWKCVLQDGLWCNIVNQSNIHSLALSVEEGSWV